MQLICGQNEDGELLADDMRECNSYQIREEDGDNNIWFTIIFEPDSSTADDNNNHKPNTNSYDKTFYPFWGEYSPLYLGLNPYSFGMFSQSSKSPYQFNVTTQYAPQLPFIFDYNSGYSLFVQPYTYSNIYLNAYSDPFLNIYSAGMPDQSSFFWWPLWTDSFWNGF